jgi:hypothetical protein
MRAAHVAAPVGIQREMWGAYTSKLHWC